MKRAALLVFGCWFLVQAVEAQPDGPSTAPPPVIRYALLDGSHFIDECLICDRPTILQPARGSFDLVRVQDTPPFSLYQVRNLSITASPGFAGEVRITGVGTYQRMEELAVTQHMELETVVEDAVASQAASFTTRDGIVERPFPLIEISLVQTNGTLLQTFSLHLIAAPLREVWFSTNRSIKPAGGTDPSQPISPGDLLSSGGRIVRRNQDLVGRLGLMPPVPDLGLDALHVTRRGGILFSIPTAVWSESLGQIQHGDVLSDQGRIVKRNQELLASFGQPATAPDAGLDALQVLPDGEMLFSIQKNLQISDELTLSHGDILSDRGRVFRTQRELLSAFHPAATGGDYGLDALHVRPGGEIWFSTELGFSDTLLGPVLPGDLLSSLGYRVFSQAQLLQGFAPPDPTEDHGLDACYLITDTKPAAPPCSLRLWLDRVGGRLRIEWDGDGEVFQLQQADSPAGPWAPCGEITPRLSFEGPCDPAARARRFYRVLQW